MALNIRPSDWVRGKFIGSGSFGKVHIAMHKTNGFLFIVKSSHLGATMKALENEVKILMKLENSPDVVRYLGKEITQGQNNECILNIFLEHMGGGSLFDVMNKFGGKLFEGAIRSYTRQLLEGLDYLHENGVIHGDIKCKNILLDSHGNVKFADFGCANIVSELAEENINLNNALQRTPNVGGTPLWMAPEVLKGERLTKAADIWSLGCTIIEMATGKPPQWGNVSDNPMSAILKIINSNENPQFPKEFSQDGQHFLEMCLERNPKKRLSTNELLRHPFIVNDRTSKTCLLKNDDAPSPASVLDVGTFDIIFSDNEEETEVNKVYATIPSSNIWTSTKPDIMKNNFQDNYIEQQAILETSENWVTVRSIDEV
ncbi:hypothetical protein vseg_019686 [Gypsophila vaccaria]